MLGKNVAADRTTKSFVEAIHNIEVTKVTQLLAEDSCSYPDVVPRGRPKAVRPDAVPWPTLAVDQGRRLKTKRLELELSLKDLAAASGVSKQTIIKLEKGEVAGNTEVIAALADALGVPRGWLAYGG